MRTTSFVFGLLPATYASRLLQKLLPNKAADPTAELKIPRWLIFILETVMRFEISLIRIGVKLPLGGSRLVVAQKAGDSFA